MLRTHREQKAVERYRLLRQEISLMSPSMAAAMLDGLGRQDIVAGQYTDNLGGACPLLAANRAGAPLHLKTEFPRVWDLFCGLKSYRQARPASRHELKILRLLLEEKLMPRSERVLPASEAREVGPASFDPPRGRRLGQSTDWERELMQLQAREKSLA